MIPEVFKRIQSSGKDLYQTINLTIFEVEEELLKKKRVDLETSGTTCCLALIKDSTLYFVNIGDSRGIFIPNIKVIFILNF